MTAWERVRLAFRRPRLAVVLGGGGTRGAYQVGVIDALAAAGVVPDLLVGTSVGAINATFWAFHPEPDAAQRLLALWLDADRSVVLPTRPVRVLRRVLRGEHLVSEDGLLRLLGRGLTPEQRLEEAPIPLTVVATDPAQGTAVRLRTGRAIPAVLASTAVPGLFAPVRVGEHDLVDGGLVANCDVEAAVEGGATDVLVVDIMGSPGALPARDLLLTIERAIDLATGRQTEQAIALAAAHARIALLRAPGELFPNFGRFEATETLFEAGRLAGQAVLRNHLRGRRVTPGRISVPGTSAPASP